MVFPSWFLGDCDVCDRRRLCCPDPRSRSELPICGGCLYTREAQEIQCEFEDMALRYEIGQVGDESYAQAFAQLGVREDAVAAEVAAWQVEQSKLEAGVVGTRAA